MTPPSEISQSDDTTSSLGDSAYDMLGESILLTSEDDDDDQDDHTDSVASIEEHGPDDVQSLAGTEESGETTSSSDRAEAHRDDHVRDRDAGLRSQEISGSGLTVTDEHRSAAPLIEFHEPPCFGAEQVAVIHTVRNFDEQQSAEVLRHLNLDDPPARVTVTIRQTMTKEGLAIEEPFRILYIGDPSAREVVAKKIGESLAVRAVTQSGFSATREPNSSRYHVIPISAFGSQKTPEVELINTPGIDLIVDECTSAKMSRVVGDSDSVSLLLNDDVWYNSKVGLDSHRPPRTAWKLPQLAIFFCSDEDSLDVRRTRHYARSFVIRHAIPSIIISKTPQYGKPGTTFTLDHHSVHMCLESRGPLGGNRVLKRLPIDLSTFLNIDAQQMNRNLACITGLHVGRYDPLESGPRSPTSSLASVSDDVEKVPRGRFGLAQSVVFSGERKGQEWRALVMLGIFLLCAVAGTASSMAYQRYDRAAWSSQESEDVRVQKTLTATATVTSTSLIVSGTSKSLPSWTKLSQTTNAVAVANTKMDLASILFDPSVTGLNESDKFKMQIVGDCHMILRPPHRFTLMKKPPRLHIQVLRNEQPVDVQLSKLFDGVYALQLEREEAYGPLNVTVSTKTKPRMEQTLEIDFGTPWLKVAGWKKAMQVVSDQIQKDLSEGQVRLLAGLERLQADVQTNLKQAAEMAKAESARLHRAYKVESSKASALFAAKARKFHDETSPVIAAKARQFSRATSEHSARLSHAFLKHASAASMQSAEYSRHLSERASKTFTVRRAQKQARLMWTRMANFHFPEEWSKRTKVERGRSCQGRRAGCRHHVHR